MDGMFSVWTPMTLILGLTFLAATARPEMRPPPPIGATIASTSGSCSMISRAIVPWPAMTSGSLKGWFRRQFNGFGCGFIEEIPVEDDIGTVAAGRRNLTQGSVFRHADDGLAAIFAGSQSHALGVVSGRSGDDAFFTFFRGQGSDFVIGPAQFKGACPLEVFQFQINFAASQIADGITVRQASLLGDAL